MTQVALNPIQLSTGLNFFNIYTIALWINMEGSGPFFNYIYGGCGDCSPPPVGTFMSETYFSKVILGYHIAPHRRFTYFIPQLVFLYPPLCKVGIGISSFSSSKGMHVHTLKCFDCTLGYYHEKNVINL